MQHKHAQTDYPINELLAQRFSPYAFDPQRAVAADDLRSLFEAARWTMSSYNAQPWRYIVGIKGEGDNWEKIHQCLVEGNQPWAANAPVLALGLVKTHFDRNDKFNKAAEHDLGAASAMLTVEATARGIAVHQMIGIESDKVLEIFAPGEGIEPLTALAIGYVGEPGVMPASYAERDESPRQRLAQGEFLL